VWYIFLRTTEISRTHSSAVVAAHARLRRSIGSAISAEPITIYNSIVNKTTNRPTVVVPDCRASQASSLVYVTRYFPVDFGLGGWGKRNPVRRQRPGRFGLGRWREWNSISRQCPRWFRLWWRWQGNSICPQVRSMQPRLSRRMIDVAGDGRYDNGY
jgi:hypothetical protein